MKLTHIRILELSYIAFMAIVLVFSAVQREWFDTGVAFAGMLAGSIPILIEKVFKTDFGVGLRSAYVLFLFASQFLGSILGFYGNGWWDTFLHFLSGVFLGLLSFDLLTRLDEKTRLSLPPRFVFLYIATFAMAGAAAWELYEFSSDVVLSTTMQGNGNQDTMIDILSGSVGGVLIASFLMNRHSRKRRAHHLHDKR